MKNKDALNEFLLRSGRYKKISYQWAHEHKELLKSRYWTAFEFFYSDEAQEEYDVADSDLKHLIATCGK